MPRRPDGEQQIQQIREYIDGSWGDQDRVSVDAMVSVEQVPDFGDGVTFEDYGK